MTVAGSWLNGDQNPCNQNGVDSKALPILSSAMDLDYFDNLPAAPALTRPPGGAGRRCGDGN